MNPDSTPVDFRNRTWWQKILLVLLTPIVITTSLVFVGIPLLIMAAVSIPISAISSRIELRRERRFQQQLTQYKRCVEWNELQTSLARVGGTVIIEWRHKRPVRLWWTADDILDLAPCDPPEFEKLDFLGFQPPHEFIEWCHKQYLNESCGTATLCVPPYSWSPGRDFGRGLCERHPNVKVVDVVPYYKLNARSAA